MTQCATRPLGIERAEVVRPRRSHVALVGIDGSGKTTAVRTLRERARGPTDVLTLHCPQCHLAPDAPLAGLSLHLEAAARAADEIGGARLKMTMLYLQMTLYGPIEDFLVHVYGPQLVVADRHPIVDTLVYGGRFAELSLAAEGEDSSDALRERLALARPGAYEAICGWALAHGRRVGFPESLDELIDAIPDLTLLPLRTAVAAYGTHFGCALPDAVVWLDVDPAEAWRRAALRAGGCAELQADVRDAHALRAAYRSTLHALAMAYPQIALHRLEDPDGTPADVLDEVMRRVH